MFFPEAIGPVIVISVGMARTVDPPMRDDDASHSSGIAEMTTAQSTRFRSSPRPLVWPARVASRQRRAAGMRSPKDKTMTIASAAEDRPTRRSSAAANIPISSGEMRNPGDSPRW